MSPRRARFSEIAHTGITFWNPISEATLMGWMEALPLHEGSRILDVGCGRGELLIRVASRYGCRGVGVDLDGGSIGVARGEAQARLPRGRLELRAEAFDPSSFQPASLDLVMCIGASHAVSDLPGALAAFRPLLKPGGLIWMGEGYWRQEPSAGYLSFLGSTREELRSHAGNLALAESLGLKVLRAHEATAEEWSAYEDTYHANVLAFVEAHPEDPDAPAMEARIRAWRDAYLRWGRETLGFGLYLLRDAA